MRKGIMLVLALLLCVALASPVFADTFVPSIGYKDGPEIEDAEIGDTDITGCIVVTSIKKAQDKTTDISQADRDLLLDVYQQLSGGSMALPLEGDYVIRELVDVSFCKAGCTDANHNHKEKLESGKETAKVTFALGVKPYQDVKVLAYVDGQWVPAKQVVNNGNGTVTCEFEALCPVAICVEEGPVEPIPGTGDAMGRNLLLWILLMVGSLAAVVVLLTNRRRFV